MRKAQTEIVIIVGLLVVVSIVIFYAYQSGLLGVSPITGITEEQKLVKNSVENLIRDGVYDTLRKLSMYGGYLDGETFPLGSVTFLGKQVPYWQYAGQVKYPDVESNFKQGVLDYLNLNKEGLILSFKKNLTLGDPKIEGVNFLSDKIIITVNMPTAIQGYAIPQPYIVEIPSRFGEAYEFSKGFVNYEVLSRPLEYYTLSSMLLSPIEDGIQTVPLFLFLTDCGEFVYKSWFDVKPWMEYAIKVTLAHTYMPGKVPLNIMETTSYPKYTLVSINGKDYENLEVSFHLPDDFELDTSSFQFTPDPIFLISEVIPFVGVCQSDPLYVEYFVSYPAIVRIKDPVTKNVFQYAIHVYILNNAPGDFGAGVSGYIPELQKEICENPGCGIDLKVIGKGGNPISSASVSFMGCSLGETNQNGILAGSAPCGAGPLEVMKSGYKVYHEMHASNELIGLTITLVKKPAVKLNFYEVIVQNLSAYDSYKIYPNDVVPLEGGFVYLYFFSLTEPGVYYQRVFDKKAGSITQIPADDYMVSASLIKDMVDVGAFLTNYTLTEDLDGESLYIHLPSTLDFGKITNTTIKAEVIVTLTNLLKKCGIEPISKTRISDFGGCIVEYNEL